MKTFCPLAVALSLATTAVHAAEEPPAKTNPADGDSNSLLQHMETLLSETNRVSYSIGVNVARNLEANFPQLNLDFFLLGLRDVLEKNARLRLTEDEINRSIARYNEISTSHVKKKFNDFKADNLQIAERFLEHNRTQEGVRTLPSGLQYRVLSEGSKEAPLPKENGSAIVDYHGKALSGRTVQSTLTSDPRVPVTIAIKDALPFWREILPKMPIGAKWEVFIHPKFAYGENGGPNVEPNELLIYSVEVVGVQ